MTGAVSAALEATLRLSVEDARGQVHEIETLLDTSFNGFLTVQQCLKGGARHFGCGWLQARNAHGVSV